MHMPYAYRIDAVAPQVLPLLPIVNPASALGLRYGGGLELLSKMLRVHVVGAAVVAALEAPEARGALSPADLEEMAPLAALRRVGPLDTLTSGLASIARLPYGTTVAEELQPVGAAGARPPAEQLRLYEFEACPLPLPPPLPQRPDPDPNRTLIQTPNPDPDPEP